MSAWSLSMHSLMLDYGVAADFFAYDLVIVWLGPSMLTCCTSPGLHVPLQRKASFNFEGHRTKNIFVESKFQHWRAVEENRLQANWVRPKEQRQNGRVLFGASCRTQIHGRLALPLMYLSRNVITWLLFAWGIFQVNIVEACRKLPRYPRHRNSSQK